MGEFFAERSQLINQGDVLLGCKSLNEYILEKKKPVPRYEELFHIIGRVVDKIYTSDKESERDIYTFVTYKDSQLINEESSTSDSSLDTL